MKVTELGQSVLEAQGKILQRMALRIGRQVAYLVVAAVFGFFAIISGHGLLWALFVDAFHMSHLSAAAIVFGLDLLFAVIFVLLGRRTIPDPVEIDARIRRDRKMAAFKQAVTISAFTSILLGPVGRFTGRAAGSGLKNIFSRR
jgi:hypothetical protein